MDIFGAMDEVRQLVFNIPGINTSYLGVPEIPPVQELLPAAIVRINPEDAGELDLGNMEIWIAKLRIDVLTERLGDSQSEVAFGLAYLPEVIAVLRNNATLNGKGTILANVTWNIGHLQLLTSTFYGSSVAIQVQSLLDVAGLISE